MKKALGWLLLLIVLGGYFVFCVITEGVIGALVVFGSVIVLVSVIAVGTYLLTS